MALYVGDIVRIRDDLVVDHKYNAVTFVSFMKKYRGKTAMITEVLGKDVYHIDLDNNGWCWSTDMFLELCTPEFEDVCDDEFFAFLTRVW